MNDSASRKFIDEVAPDVWVRTARLVFSTLVLVFVSFRANAVSSGPDVKMSLIQNGRPEPVNWDHQITPLWENNSEGGLEFYWTVQVNIPNPSAISSIQTGNVRVVFPDSPRQFGMKNRSDPAISRTNDGISIKMASLKQVFVAEYTSGKRSVFSVELASPESISISDHCEQYFLKLAPKTENETEPPPQLPGYIASHCEKTGSGLELSVSVPSETSWISNSLFEAKGKGKRWKVFEVNPQLPTSGQNVIGEFVFQVGKRRFTYTVQIEKRESAERPIQFRMSLGPASLSIQHAAVGDSVSKPAAHVSFELHPIRPEFSLGGTGIATIPTGSGDFFSHSESVGYFGWTLTSSKNLSFEPRLYIYMAEGLSQKINYFYKLNAPAIGGTVQYSINTKSSLQIEAIEMLQSQTKGTSVRIYWNQDSALKNSQLSTWGIAVILQKIEITTGDSKDSATQIFIGPTLGF